MIEFKPKSPATKTDTDVTLSNNPNANDVTLIVSTSPSQIQNQNSDQNLLNVSNSARKTSLDNLDEESSISSFGDEDEVVKKPGQVQDDDEVVRSDKKPSWFSKYGGILMTLFAGLNFTLASIFAKLLWEGYGFNAYSTTFWRYFGVLIIGVPMFVYFEFFSKKLTTKPTSAVWPLNNKQRIGNSFGLLIRGILGTSAVIFRYYAIEYIPLGDMNVISFSTPILVTVMAHFFLGEKCGIVPIIAALVALVGVFVIVRPPLLTGESHFDDNALIGTGFACGSLIFGAIIIVLTRKMRAIHFSLMTLVFGVIGVLEPYLLTLPSKQTIMYPNGGNQEVLYVVGLGTVSVIGQIAIIIATQMEEAGLVSLLRTNDVILGFIFEYLVFSIVPTIYSAIGGVIVLTAICVIGFRKWISTLPEENRKRKMFSFILK